MSILGAALALAGACAEPERPSVDPEAAFRAQLGIQWELSRLGSTEILPPADSTPPDVPGIDLVPGRRPTIRFIAEPPGAGGRTFCNGYGTPYELRGDSLRFTRIESSGVGCDGPDSLETRFFRALWGTRRFEIDSINVTLITEDGTRITFVQAPSRPSALADTVCAVAPPSASAGSRIVWVHFACESPAAVPGQLYRASRRVDANADPVDAALRELVRGPSSSERAVGLSSFFSAETMDVLKRVNRNARGDTITIDFSVDLPRRLADAPGVKSFLPPGVMAELTGTVFAQFPEVQAIRLQLGGSERAFWHWLGGEPQVYTRQDWERI